MPCYHPLDATQIPAPHGHKSQISFNLSDRPKGIAIKLPCGQCVGCRLERSRQWAIRCQHEVSLHQKNCFITLTFNNHHLPADRSLDVRYFQKFMKRLRKRFGANIRFYHCGEYGDKYGRPHYHALLFNFDFPDKYIWRRTSQGHLCWRSPALEELWPFGNSEIGEANFQTAAYVARYIMKKINGKRAEEHYEYMDPSTGQIFKLKPEYTTMSRRPGIGKKWLDKFSSDVYPGDFVVINGKKMRPPKYYDKQFEISDPSTMEEIKWIRSENAKKYLDDNSKERLAVKEQVQLSKLKHLPRNHE